ncbi:MAG: GTPase Era [Candidatus Porifericomitaceae bacterium WSBS_2022_MAG_OTU9]
MIDVAMTTGVGSSGGAKVALLGRPNVGKSTLFNYVVGEKYSITSSRAQTTRCQIAAMDDSNSSTALWVDTPGIDFHHRHNLHRVMHKSAMAAVYDADINIFLIEALRWLPEDERIWQALLQADSVNNSTLVVINKCDRVKDKGKLLPYVLELGKINGMAGFSPLFVSSRTGRGVDNLVAEVQAILVNHVRTDATSSKPLEHGVKDEWHFLAAELMREKLVCKLSNELPHQLFVQTDSIKDSNNTRFFDFSIIVATKGQKGITIGKGGAILKDAGRLTRLELERRLGCKVYITSKVKIHSNWFNDPQQLAAATGNAK